MAACGVEKIVEIVGDRWSLLLIGALLRGPKRTTELAAALAPISTRTLAERLKRLEGAGVLTRRAYAEAPPRVEYELTARGRELRHVLHALHRAAAVWEMEDCTKATCVVCDDVAADVLPPKARAAHAEHATARRQSVDVTLL
jgi:DNA-binding HxlR family transcriptional regulator